jgi:integrase
LNVQAVNILHGLRPRSEGEFVFASPSTRSDGGPIRWLFYANQRLRKACGFEFRLHDLRRTCASGLAELGVDRDTISKILGHRSADSGVIGIYDRYDREPEKRRALRAWGDHVEQIVTGKTAEKVIGRTG